MQSLYGIRDILHRTSCSNSHRYWRVEVNEIKIRDKLVVVAAAAGRGRSTSGCCSYSRGRNGISNAGLRFRLTWHTTLWIRLTNIISSGSGEDPRLHYPWLKTLHSFWSFKYKKSRQDQKQRSSLLDTWERSCRSIDHHLDQKQQHILRGIQELQVWKRASQ